MLEVNKINFKQKSRESIYFIINWTSFQRNDLKLGRIKMPNSKITKIVN